MSLEKYPWEPLSSFAKLLSNVLKFCRQAYAPRNTIFNPQCTNAQKFSSHCSYFKLNSASNPLTKVYAHESYLISFMARYQSIFCVIFDVSSLAIFSPKNPWNGVSQVEAPSTKLRASERAPFVPQKSRAPSLNQRAVILSCWEIFVLRRRMWKLLSYWVYFNSAKAQNSSKISRKKIMISRLKWFDEKKSDPEKMSGIIGLLLFLLLSLANGRPESWSSNLPRGQQITNFQTASQQGGGLLPFPEGKNFFNHCVNL